MSWQRAVIRPRMALGGLAATLMLSSSALAQSQSVFQCQVSRYSENPLLGGMYRDEKSLPDFFRLQIIGPGQIKIMGSDFFRNGTHAARKTGTRYAFPGMINWGNDLATFAMVGPTEFNQDTGEIYQNGVMQWFMGPTKTQWSGNCE